MAKSQKKPPKSDPKKVKADNDNNEAAFFEAANRLRGSVESAEYKHLVLDLVFLSKLAAMARLDPKDLIDAQGVAEFRLAKRNTVSAYQRRHAAMPIAGSSLKQVEKIVGFERSTDVAKGDDSIVALKRRKKPTTQNCAQRSSPTSALITGKALRQPGLCSNGLLIFAQIARRPATYSSSSSGRQRVFIATISSQIASAICDCDGCFSGGIKHSAAIALKRTSR